MNNKKRNILTILIIAIILILAISSSLSMYLNYYASRTTISYDITQKIWKFRYNGGVPIQITASMLSYLGITIGSIFDEDIRNDMNSINWNIFNTDEMPVLNSEKVSFYKGVPVFKFNHNRSGSFLAIFISRQQESVDTLYHEFGHNIQQLVLGPIKYLLCIGLPSMFEWSNRYYYNRPWEITADIFGDVTLRKHTVSDTQRGYSYLDVSAMFGPLSYSFLKDELNYINIKIKKIYPSF